MVQEIRYVSGGAFIYYRGEVGKFNQLSGIMIKNKDIFGGIVIMMIMYN